jgi:electron transport complex protein RnfB
MLQVAVVTESACIGCAACLNVCPTGALVGATKQVHSVLESLCTGCGACIEACPVPCITMKPWASEIHPMQGVNTAAAEAATAAHTARMASPTERQQREGKAMHAIEIGDLSPELTALAAAARAKAQTRQTQKGPRKQPPLGS